MLHWFKSKRSKRWTRQTRWTPLLQSQREFQRTLAKERLRSDRQGHEFGLLILRFTNLESLCQNSVRLAKVLHRRLRETDEKGHLGYGRIGVMLPNTSDLGSEFVLDDLLRLAKESAIPIEGEYFVYPDRSKRDRSAEHVDEHHEHDHQDPLEPVEVFAHPPESRARAVPVTLFSSPYPMWKRALDIVGSSIGLVVASPVIASAAIVIRATSPGPAFFAQERTGYLGKPFRIYKLRTMVQNAEDLKASLREKNERDGPAFKMISDPRITRVGRFLRSTGLDELPQLVNVLVGDMALVGPRPLPTDEHEQCENWHRRRLDTKPGLTCYWQIAKTRKMTFAEWMRLDMRYGRRRSLFLDTKLILKTVSAVFFGRVGH